MTAPILNIDEAPTDPIERLVWLGGVQTQVRRELNAALQEAYFWARFTGRLDEATALDLHSQRRIMAWTRAENEVRGRMIRWNDSLS